MTKYLLERLTEKTTWLGLAGLVGVAFGGLSDETLSAVGAAVSSVAALVLILFKDKLITKSA